MAATRHRVPSAAAVLVVPLAHGSAFSTASIPARIASIAPWRPAILMSRRSRLPAATRLRMLACGSSSDDTNTETRPNSPEGRRFSASSSSWQPQWWSRSSPIFSLIASSTSGRQLAARSCWYRGTGSRSSLPPSRGWGCVFSEPEFLPASGGRSDWAHSSPASHTPRS